MSDAETDPMEALIQQHKQENKQLQAQIQKIKHEVPKGDKKKKKESLEKIAQLQSELEQKQEKELADLRESSKLTQKVTEQMGDLKTQDCVQQIEETQATGGAGDKRISKAQKRRDKKAGKDKERQERIMQQDIDNLSGVRHLEYQNIKAALKILNLQISEIKSDGNCLYNAINHQLMKFGLESSNKELRQKAAAYMKEKQDEFLPFLTKDNGDPFTEEDFNSYCDETASTTAWGGQHEIRALSHVLKLPIQIIQSEVPPIKIGEEFEANSDNNSITLCYHRHAYGLGEHYNSVEELKDDDEGFDNS